jgi:hypothetical protein
VRADRSRAVHAALDEGWSHARIATATDLTRGRVEQLAQSRPE